MKNPATINPPAARATNKISMPVSSPPAKGDSAAGSAGVAVGDGACAAALSSVGDGVKVAAGSGVGVAGGGMGVSVAGGVTCSSSFSPGKMIELALSPFHAISSPMFTP